MKRILAIILSVVLIFGMTVNADTREVENFVVSLYNDCLDREPDEVGLNYWVNNLTSGSITGKECAHGFFYSQEFLAKANNMTKIQLIDVYYRVFLNREADASGRLYWVNRLESSNNYVSTLFNGFADSDEFIQKCASYGISANGSINNSVYTDLPTNYSNALSYTATSPDHLDAIWTNLGYEIYYIDLGNGHTQKCYAHFYDVTDHYTQVNNYRTQNGLYMLNVSTDSARVNETRLRAVEICYTASHAYPSRMGRTGAPYRVANRTGENFCAGLPDGAFEWWLTSPSHLANITNTTYHRSMTAACCDVVFVNPDGVSVSYRSNAAERGLAPSIDICTVELFWGT